MLKFIKNLFNFSKTKQLEEEVTALKAKLVEKQEQINCTNSYYKKVIREIKKAKSK